MARKKKSAQLEEELMSEAPATMTKAQQKAYIKELEGKAPVDMPIEQITVRPPFEDAFQIHEPILESIKTSIETYGYDPTKPVLLWSDPEGRNTLLAGHTRLQASKQLERPTIPAVVLPQTTFSDDAEAKRYVLQEQFYRRQIGTSEELLRVIVDNDFRNCDLEKIGESGSRRARIAALTHFQEATVQRALRVADHPEKSEAVLHGELSLNQAHEEIKQEEAPPEPEPKAPAEASAATPPEPTAPPIDEDESDLGPTFEDGEEESPAEEAPQPIATEPTPRSNDLPTEWSDDEDTEPEPAAEPTEGEPGYSRGEIEEDEDAEDFGPSFEEEDEEDQEDGQEEPEQNEAEIEDDPESEDFSHSTPPKPTPPSEPQKRKRAPVDEIAEVFLGYPDQINSGAIGDRFTLQIIQDFYILGLIDLDLRDRLLEHPYIQQISRNLDEIDRTADGSEEESDDSEELSDTESALAE